jgi:signal transduction histidine kinase
MTPRGDAESVRLEKLQAVVDAALAHLSVDALLDELLPRVKELLEADTCAVLLLDEHAGELFVRAASGLEEEVEQGVRIPVGKGFAGRIAAERRPVVIDEVDHSNVLNPILHEQGIRSLVGAPLISQDRVLGVIHAGSLRPRLFRTDDVSLLELVASRVALAVERALAHEELVRLAELKSTFVGVASHELRTPVSVVYGISETIHHRWDELDEETRLSLHEALYQQSRRLRLLVEQLLDLSRLDTRSTRIDPQPLGVRDRVEELVRLAEPEAAEQVEVDIDPDLEFVVDRNALDHVVTNLLTNALRYGAPPVTIAAVARDTHYRLWVEDRGDGVDPDFVPQLFERFTRGDDARADSGAAGLGLAIALAYATAHGGTITYEAAAPTGAHFELVVPRSRL